MNEANKSTEREIISFGGTVEEVGGEDPCQVVINNCGNRITLSGVQPATAREFALHLYENVYFSIKVKS